MSTIHTTRLQIPMDDTVRTALEKRAISLGFDSAQAYIRVWAKAETEGRRLDFDSKVTVLSPEADARYTRMASELDAARKTGDTKTFSDVADFMKDL